MHDLEVVKTLQVVYQAKFSELLKLQEELNAKGIALNESQEYNLIKQEWLKASADLKAHIELHKI